MSHEVFLGAGVRTGRTATNVSPLPKGQLHLTVDSRSSRASPLSWAQLWLPYILDRGHFLEKHNGIFKTTSDAKRQSSVARVPPALTIGESTLLGDFPVASPVGSPAFFLTPIISLFSKLLPAANRN